METLNDPMRVAEISQTLTDGFISSTGSSIFQLEKLLEELLWRQQELYSRLANRNLSYSDNAVVKEVHMTMIHTQQYYRKLLQIKKDMMDNHVKAAKLKVRVKKLSDAELAKLETRRKVKEIEDNLANKLIAKPAGTS